MCTQGTGHHSGISTDFLNNDAYPDVVASVWYFDYIEVYINSGARSNWAYQRIDSSTDVMPPLIMNVDGMFGNDIVTKRFTTQQWRIHTSTHATNAQYTITTETFASQVGGTDVRTGGSLDFDGDGKIDIFLGDSGGYVQIYRNEYGEGSRHFSNNAALYQNVGFAIFFSDVGDINNDGVEDIVVGAHGTAYILCNGDGTWENRVILQAANSFHHYGGIKIFDIDG